MLRNKLFEKVDQYRKPGTLLAQIHQEFPLKRWQRVVQTILKSTFLGTHFFNPPRYLKLLEVIPTKDN